RGCEGASRATSASPPPDTRLPVMCSGWPSPAGDVLDECPLARGPVALGAQECLPGRGLVQVLPGWGGDPLQPGDLLREEPLDAAPDARQGGVVGRVILPAPVLQ